MRRLDKGLKFHIIRLRTAILLQLSASWTNPHNSSPTSTMAWCQVWPQHVLATFCRVALWGDIHHYVTSQPYSEPILLLPSQLHPHTDHTFHTANPPSLINQAILSQWFCWGKNSCLQLVIILYSNWICQCHPGDHIPYMSGPVPLSVLLSFLAFGLAILWPPFLWLYKIFLLKTKI